ncbi:hypothetical protein HDU85_001770 [Gaertneriomyces sp. JEL0708]|nr:hypothetical protein HDU85_001770 [Gaertneriomyces sp. JEL0708]
METIQNMLKGNAPSTNSNSDASTNSFHGNLSVIPDRERNTPAEHLHDFPNLDKSLKTGVTTEQIHAAHAHEIRDRDLAGMEKMTNDRKSHIEAAEAGQEHIKSPAEQYGTVMPKRISDARKARE